MLSFFLEDLNNFHPNIKFSQMLYGLSQPLRVSRICSKKSDVLKHLEKMKSWFSVRGHPEYLIKSEVKKVKFVSKNRNTKRGKSLKAVPFVMTYHPKLKSMKKLFLNI